MFLTVFLFSILLIYTRKLNKKHMKIVWVSFIFGLLLILLHTMMLYNSYGVWFAGSDALEYYNDGLLLKEFGLSYLNELFKYKYWGYIFYNALAMYPVNSLMIVSFIIRISNLIIYMFALTKVLLFISEKKIDITSDFKKIILVSFIAIGYWGAFFNFRDIIVGVLILFIFTTLFSKKSNIIKIILISIYFLTLLFFRDEMIILITASIFIVFITVHVTKVRNKTLIITFLLFSMFFIYAYIPLPTFQSIYDTLGQFGLSSIFIRRLYGMELIFTSLRNLISSILGLNPFHYGIYIITDSFETTWVLSPLSGFFSVIFGFISYFLVMSFFFFVIFNNRFLYRNENKEYINLFLSIFTVFLFVILSYSIKLGNFQERIRLMIFPLFLFSMLILKYDRSDMRNYWYYIILFWILAILYLIRNLIINL